LLYQLFNKLRSGSEVYLCGFGCSVEAGAATPDPATQAPSADLYARLKAELGSLASNLKHQNFSFSGASLADFGLQWASAQVAVGGKIGLCTIGFNMIHSSPNQYNQGMGRQALEPRLVGAITTIRQAGADVILYTSPHEHTGRTVHSINGGPMVYPTVHNPPVLDEPDPQQPSVPFMVPPRSQSTRAIHDGIAREAVRMADCNGAYVAIGRDLVVPVIDAGAAWIEALRTFSVDQLYDANEFYHPNLVGHQLSFHARNERFVKLLRYGVL
jgi:hypothetical protein